MQLIFYCGWPLALAEPDRVHPHPAVGTLSERDESDPLVRFAFALALHAFEIDTGLVEGPFDQARAERYARDLLMPANDFAPLAEWPEVELAALLGCLWSRCGRGALSLPGRPPAPSRRDGRASRAHARARKKRRIDHPKPREDQWTIRSSCSSPSAEPRRAQRAP